MLILSSLSGIKDGTRGDHRGWVGLGGIFGWVGLRGHRFVWCLGSVILSWVGVLLIKLEL